MLVSTVRSEADLYESDARWLLAKRMVASRSLGRSRLLSQFLLHVVECQIAGRSGDVIEQRIGMLVFGRVEGYDSNEDNIVRNYARMLRRRIHEYFIKEGRHEPIVLHAADMLRSS